MSATPVGCHLRVYRFLHSPSVPRSSALFSSPPPTCPLLRTHSSLAARRPFRLRGWRPAARTHTRPQYFVRPPFAATTSLARSFWFVHSSLKRSPRWVFTHATARRSRAKNSDRSSLPVGMVSLSRARSSLHAVSTALRSWARSHTPIDSVFCRAGCATGLPHISSLTTRPSSVCSTIRKTPVCSLVPILPTGSYKRPPASTSGSSPGGGARSCASPPCFPLPRGRARGPAPHRHPARP